MRTVISICGLKNSGKTTLITRLTEALSISGYKVAVIKHDGHDFECDIPGTDTNRFTMSGAYGVACFSDDRTFIHKQGTGDSADELIKLFPEADIIFVEGLKDSNLDKIEVIRKEISDEPVSNPEGRFLIATDWAEGTFNEETANINDIDAIVSSIRERASI